MYTIMPLISYISIPIVKDDGSVQYVRIQLDKNYAIADDVNNMINQVSLATTSARDTGRFERD